MWVAWATNGPADNLRRRVTSANILVVEDDVLTRSLLVHALESAGYTVVSVNDGRQAINSLRQGSFDIMVTDLMMPHVDGLELIGTVKTDFPGTLVIAVSSGSTSRPMAFLPLAKALGADITLEKPVLPRITLEAVKMLLQRRSQGAG